MGKTAEEMERESREFRDFLQKEIASRGLSDGGAMGAMAEEIGAIIKRVAGDNAERAMKGLALTNRFIIAGMGGEAEVIAERIDTREEAEETKQPEAPALKRKIN